jgi:hypothetical protein
MKLALPAIRAFLWSLIGRIEGLKDADTNTGHPHLMEIVR